MKTFIQLCFISLLMLQHQGINAQIFGKLAQKLEEKVKERLKIPTTPAKSSPQNTPNNGTTTKEESSAGEGKILGNILGKLGGGNIDFNAKPQASYAFQMYGINKLTMISVKEKEPQITLTKTMFHLDQLFIGVTILDKNEVEQSDKGIIILDPRKMEYFTFLTNKEGKKTYFGMHIKEQPTPKTEPTTTNKPTTASTQKQKPLIKTNRTKVILGIKCDGYSQDGEKGEVTTYWLAPQSSLAGLAEYNKAMEKYGKSTPNIGKSTPQPTEMDDELAAYIKQGKVMLGHDVVQKNGDQMWSEIYKVKADAPSSFSTVGYKSGL
jgi:hypothetical protein